MNKYKRTHNLIKESILNILLDKSISNITINDICSKSYITRSTFYTHYKDKYHVLECINKEICSKLEKYLNIRFSETDIDSVIITLINDIDKKTFLTMIDIQDGNVNLKKDIQNTIELSAYKYFESINIGKKSKISANYSGKLFSTIVMTSLEYSMRYGEIEQNAAFLNDLNRIILSNYSKLEE